jgi:hypothetical protein
MCKLNIFLFMEKFWKYILLQFCKQVFRIVSLGKEASVLYVLRYFRNPPNESELKHVSLVSCVLRHVSCI